MTKNKIEIEFINTVVRLSDLLLNESFRGAILISAAFVEDCLGNLIETNLPEKNKKYKKRLLSYPGPLSSFSSRIELSYAFRLINKNVYDSLNVLRKVRNTAAHSANVFTYSDFQNEFQEIYNLNLEIATLIKNIPKELMHIHNESILREVAKKGNFSSDVVENYKKNQENFKSKTGKLEEELNLWRMVYGISIICIMIKNVK